MPQPVVVDGPSSRGRRWADHCRSDLGLRARHARRRTGALAARHGRARRPAAAAASTASALALPALRAPRPAPPRNRLPRRQRLGSGATYGTRCERLAVARISPDTSRVLARASGPLCPPSSRSDGGTVSQRDRTCLTARRCGLAADAGDPSASNGACSRAAENRNEVVVDTAVEDGSARDRGGPREGRRQDEASWRACGRSGQARSRERAAVGPARTTHITDHGGAALSDVAVRHVRRAYNRPDARGGRKLVVGGRLVSGGGDVGKRRLGDDAPLFGDAGARRSAAAIRRRTHERTRPTLLPPPPAHPRRRRQALPPPPVTRHAMPKYTAASPDEPAPAPGSCWRETVATSSASGARRAARARARDAEESVAALRAESARLR